MSQTKLSLCMIVKDEEDLLPECLRSVDGLIDELCVVDTGSTDRTLEILGEASARVVERPWTGDFSAARNASLEMATGEWVLFLDADERLSPALVAEIRAVLDDPAAGAATVILRNPLPNGAVREAPLLRLFRNDPSIRFRYRIHEDITDPVTRYLETHHLQLRRLSGRVDHLGYIRERATQKDKKTRDIEILRACVQDDPEDFYSWFKLLELARFWRDDALWKALAREVEPHLERLDASGFSRNLYAGELLALTSMGLHDSPADALRFLAPHRDRVHPSAALHLRLAELHEALGRHDAATREFQACLDLPPSRDIQLTHVRPLLGLARLALLRGDAKAAVDFADRALIHAPRDPEGLFMRLSGAFFAGGDEEVEAWEARYLRDHGDHPALQAARGDLDISRHRWSHAATRYQAALSFEPSTGHALRLSKVLVALGQVDTAAELLIEIQNDEPEAALGLLVCDVILGRPSQLEIHLSQERADQALRDWIYYLVKADAPEPLGGFLDHADTILPYFPWLPEHLGSLVAPPAASPAAPPAASPAAPPAASPAARRPSTKRRGQKRRKK